MTAVVIHHDPSQLDAPTLPAGTAAPGAASGPVAPWMRRPTQTNVDPMAPRVAAITVVRGRGFTACRLAIQVPSALTMGAQ